MKGKMKRNSHVIIFVLEPQRYTKWVLNLFLNQANKTLWGFFLQEEKNALPFSGEPWVTAEVSSSEWGFIYILLSTEYLIEKLEFSKSTPEYSLYWNSLF